jgi:hypothetical protein
MNYRYDVDDDKHFSKEPLHDWASHAADAFGYMAVALKEPRAKQREFKTRPALNTMGRVQPGGWMGI